MSDETTVVNMTGSIEPGVYRTREGLLVTVTEVMGFDKSMYPICGMTYTGEVVTWARDGRTYLTGEDEPSDLYELIRLFPDHEEKTMDDREATEIWAENVLQGRTGPDLRQVGGDHYARLGIQPWKAMEAWMGHDEFAGFLRGNVIKYMARRKGGTEDLRKARHYLDKLIKHEEGNDE